MCMESVSVHLVDQLYQFTAVALEGPSASRVRDFKLSNHMNVQHVLIAL